MRGVGVFLLFYTLCEGLWLREAVPLGRGHTAPPRGRTDQEASSSTAKPVLNTVLSSWKMLLMVTVVQLVGRRSMYQEVTSSIRGRAHAQVSGSVPSGGHTGGC